MKICSQCDLEKSDDEFYRYNKSRCKLCILANRRKWKNENKEKQREYQRRSYRKHHEARLEKQRERNIVDVPKRQKVICAECGKLKGKSKKIDDDKYLCGVCYKWTNPQILMSSYAYSASVRALEFSLSLQDLSVLLANPVFIVKAQKE